jgi:hypothetical protein
MGEQLDQVPEKLREHLRSIAGSGVQGSDEEYIEAIAGAWLEKRDIFDKQVADAGMEPAETFAHDSERGALLMTYSGSLLTIGPLREDVRRVEYSSIGLRHDVPDGADHDAARLAVDVTLDNPAEFAEGPVKQSSPIYRIAIAPPGTSTDDEEVLLSNVTKVVTREFVDVNQTVVPE